MNHTPGPWEVEIYGKPGDFAIRPIGVIVNNLANAKLIATAPDLLEALTEALDFIERFGGQRHLLVTGCQCAHCIIIESAKAAIAKATE